MSPTEFGGDPDQDLDPAKDLGDRAYNLINRVSHVKVNPRLILQWCSLIWKNHAVKDPTVRGDLICSNVRFNFPTQNGTKFSHDHKSDSGVTLQLTWKNDSSKTCFITCKTFGLPCDTRTSVVHTHMSIISYLDQEPENHQSALRPRSGTITDKPR